MSEDKFTWIDKLLLIVCIGLCVGLLFMWSRGAKATDVPAYLIDDKTVTAGDQQTKLIDAAKAMFGSTINLQATQRFYCSRTEKDACTLEEAGVCTKVQFAAALRAGINVVALAVNGTNVTYRRMWEPVEVEVGTKRDAIVAYLTAVHPDVTIQFLLDFAVMRQGSAIKSRAAYLSVVDDQELAQLSVDKKLLRLAPQ